MHKSIFLHLSVHFKGGDAWEENEPTRENGGLGGLDDPRRTMLDDCCRLARIRRHIMLCDCVIRSDPVFLHGSGSGFQIFWIRFQPRFWKIAERSLKVISQKKT